MARNSQTNVSLFLTTINGSSGKKYKSDYRAILTWVVDKVKKSQTPPKNSSPKQDGWDYISEELNKIKEGHYG